MDGRAAMSVAPGTECPRPDKTAALKVAQGSLE